jgi:hypothetical protein
MLKVVYFEPKETTTGAIEPPAYKIEYTGGSLRLGVKGNVGQNRDVDTSVDIPLDSYKGKTLEATIRDTHKMNDLAVRKVYDKVTPVSATQDMTYPRTVSVAEISVDENAEEIVLLLTLNTTAPEILGENVSAKKVKRTKPAAGLMRDHSAFFKDFYDKKFIPKCELIKDTDIYDSIAYLEAQLDAVTRLLLAILPPEADAGLKAALEAADAHSVLKIKSGGDIAGMLDKDKGGFRQRQKAYLQKRAALKGK